MDDTFGATLRRLRRQRGLSLRQLGQATAFDFSYLSQIERGSRPPTGAVAAGCDRALDATGALLQAHRRDREGRAGDVHRRSLLAGLAALAGGPLAPEAARSALAFAIDDRRGGFQVDDWQAIAADYNSGRCPRNPRATMESLVRDLAVLTPMVHQHGETPVGRDLRAVAAQLSATAAVATAMLGDAYGTGRWWRVARQAARTAGDPKVDVWIRGSQIVSGLYERRRHTELVALADETEATRPPPSPGLARTLAGKAQVLAAAGRGDAAVKTLRRVYDIVGRLPAPSLGAPGWPESRLRHAESLIFTRLGLTRQAYAAQDRCFALYGPHARQTRAQVAMHRAACMVSDGDVVAGTNYAQQELDALPPDLHNDLLTQTGWLVVRAAATRDQRRAADLAARLRAAT